MIIDEQNHLAHYGILRRSGRYPWGSGGTPYERATSFIGTVKDLRDKGLTDAEIARGFSSEEHPFTTADLRNATTIARNARKQADIAMAQRLHDKGWSNVAIGKRMGKPESTVRTLLEPGAKAKADILKATAEKLREQVAEKKYIDVGKGVELHMGISHEKLKAARRVLQDEGYTMHYVKVDQLGTGKQTTLKVLAAPGTTYSEVLKNRDEISQPFTHSDDGGRSYTDVRPPISVDSKRVAVRYAEQGGTDADGVIYVRPGVSDLSLGKSNYAQVRIAVDGTHYLKGMAMYRDDLPPGVDLMFNTNKSNTGDKHDAMKKMKTDKDGKIDHENPFGAVIKPGGQRGALNVVNEEGDWGEWSKNLSSQMLSKQSHALAKSQLDMTYESKKRELDEISALTNPTVKKRLLESYSDGADSSAVHLKAAALPRQASHVILPINTMKENEVYAPNYRDGERVVLIRYPHGGKFEIPELTVNNRQRDAKKLLGQATDAIGIHSKVAERLSGADFDGDTVLVIPNNQGRVKTEPPLEGLKGFDPQRAYPAYEGMPKMSARTKGIQMGLVSNLITDMTIRGATNAELARAVRHSMVVIDAEKHNLNYKQSAIDNGIADLMEKYQKRRTGGASTVISNSGKATERINERKARPAKEGGPIDKATGKRMYVDTGATYTKTTISKRTGEERTKTENKKIEVSKLGNTDDAHTLSSGTPIEKIYADHSNRLKALANQARKEMVNTENAKYSPSAKTAYANEVASLEAKLNLALRNAPLERQAQVIANAVYRQKLARNPDMEASEKKKVKSQALTTARNRTGAQKSQIEITDKEWAAIQAGAITPNKLTQILSNADLDAVKKLATPKASLTMSQAKKNQATMLLRNNYTQAEVADALGVSVTTLKRSLSEV